MYWYEFVPPNLHRTGNMVPVDKLAGFKPAGYRSVYGFSEEDAKLIRLQQSSRGFSRFPVFSDHLILDIDGGDEQMKRVVSRLDELGFAYDVWISGGKGYHIIIPHEGLYSPYLPYSHLFFVEHYGIECDKSVFRHGSLISLPGRISQRTGRPKQFVESVPGDKAEVLIVIPDLTNIPVAEDLDLAFALRRVCSLAENEPEQGRRHTLLWSVASNCAVSGMSRELCNQLLQEVNASWKNPKDQDEVERAVSQAYRT